MKPETFQLRVISPTRIQKQSQTLSEREQAFITQTQAQKTLTGKPDDPKANFAVGLWLAVYESNWEQALPKLVLGSDAKWKAAVAAEPKSPSEIEGQLSAADTWWEAAQSATGEAKLAAQRRAHEWYDLRASAHSGGDGRMGGEREGDAVCNIACRVGRVISECREAVL